MRNFVRWMVFGILATGTVANAGTAVSGGGPGIVCASVTSPIGSVQTLDLYEGCVRFNACPVKSNEPMANQLLSAALKLRDFNYFMYRDFSDTLTYIFSNQYVLPAGVGMQAGLDVGTDYPPVVPVGCRLESIGYFEKSGKLAISSSLMNAMSATEQAAFIAHEALYKITRERRQTPNSQEVRKLVAYLFSSADLKDLGDVAPLFSNHRNFRVKSGAKTLSLSVDNPRAGSVDISLSCTSGVDNQIVAEAQAVAQTSTRFSLGLPLEGCRTLKITTGSKSLSLAVPLKYTLLADGEEFDSYEVDLNPNPHAQFSSYFNIYN